jgi:hypothetical protein
VIVVPSPPKFQPALFGGAVMGILSALPFVNFANCCCVWMITGGIVAAWVMQQNHAAAVSVLDGMAVGLLAGLVGAFIWLIVSYPINLAMSPFLQALGQRILDNARDVPPEVQDALERFGAGRAGMAIGFAMNLFLGMIFSTLGGMLGALLFRKSVAPPPVEPSDRWSGGPPSPLLPTDGSLPPKLTPPPDAPGGPPPVA